MGVSLLEAAAANFRTDEQSDRLNEEFMRRLGMRKRYLPARLAISRSLAMSSPLEVGGVDLDGKVIKGDTLFGTGTALSVWLGLIVERAAATPEVDVKQLVAIVGAHWRRGLQQLDKDWEQSGRDLPSFISRVVEGAELRFAGSQRGTLTIDSAQTDPGGLIEVVIGEIGEETSSRETMRWSLNGVGSSPHSAIMGGVGSGKTRTAVAMLRSIHEQARVPLLAFDFKGDLGTDSSGGGYALDRLFDAEVLEPPRMPIPLDVLALPSRDAIDIAEASSRFREAFSRLKASRIGDRQRNAVHEACSRALVANSPCRLEQIREALEQFYQEEEMKEDGAVATMREICRFPLFVPKYQPHEFFSRSWIVRLPPNVDEDSRTIVINLILNSLDQYLNSLADSTVSSVGARSMRIMCVVDEAHRVLGTRLPALSNLIRMSRSKGGGCHAYIAVAG